MPSGAGGSLGAALAPIAFAIFVAYLVIGMALPVLPLHVHDRLGMGTFVVGLVAGSQFTASLFSRLWSGAFADRRGAKLAVVVGLAASALAGGLYLASLAFVDAPAVSAAVLIAGRGLLGAAESFITMGILAWGLAIGGPQRGGRVMAWIGTAIYLGFAVGAPAGSAIYAAYGFGALALATVVAPIAALAIVARVPPSAPSAHARPSYAVVLRAVAMPGLGLSLSSVGYGAITIFMTLMFAERGWAAGWLAISVLAFAVIACRIFLGGLPDRIGGVKVALVSLLVEAAGQAMIWLAPSPALVFVGAALTGAGYSLTYPGFGLEAARRAPPESRGMAMGVYTACLDLTLGVAGPLLGLVAAHTSLSTVFLISTLVVLSGSLVALRLLASAGAASRA